MGNWRDRFEKSINQKTGRKLYTKEHGYPPTVREFGELIGVKSTSSAFSRIKQLEQNGYIRRIPASPRAIEIL